jgi:ADP-ribose pyrophosphatase
MTEIRPEPTVSSETAFSGRLIDVRIDTVKLPDGRLTKREIVVHPQVVAVLPILDGRIVMVRQFRKAANRVLLEVPAGGIEPEESPEEAVKREMTEETGYSVGSLRLLASFYTSPGFTTEYMHLYEARDLTAGEATEDTDEIQVQLLTVEEAWQRVGIGEIDDCKTLLALFFASRGT